MQAGLYYVRNLQFDKLGNLIPRVVPGGSPADPLIPNNMHDLPRAVRLEADGRVSSMFHFASPAWCVALNMPPAMIIRAGLLSSFVAFLLHLRISDLKLYARCVGGARLFRVWQPSCRLGYFHVFARLAGQAAGGPEGLFLTGLRRLRADQANPALSIHRCAKPADGCRRMSDPSVPGRSAHCFNYVVWRR